MNVPTPLNDTARDDRFDRGLSRLLDGNPAGIDEIEPDLQNVAVQMVRLANDAGWIGTDPGLESVHTSPRWRDWRLVSNVAAAVAVVGILAGMSWLGLQFLQDRDGGQYGSQPTAYIGVDIGPGVCSRAARTDAEIAAIVRKSEEQVTPFQSNGIEAAVETEALQLTRDWNSCLQAKQYDRATAYESEYFIWFIGQSLFPEGTKSLTDAEIAAEVRSFHTGIKPIVTEDGTNLAIYPEGTYRIVKDSNGMKFSGGNVWIFPQDSEGGWDQWPTVVLIEWDGTQWVFVSTSQSGVPEGPYTPFDNNDDSTPTSVE